MATSYFAFRGRDPGRDKRLCLYSNLTRLEINIANISCVRTIPFDKKFNTVYYTVFV